MRIEFHTDVVSTAVGAVFKLTAAMAIFTASASVSFAGSTASLSSKSEIGFTAEANYAEGLSWSASQNRFFIGSMTHGTIGTVSPDGLYKPFISDQKLVSTVGVLVDEARNTLWAVNSDPGVGDRTQAATQGRIAGIARYNATTGERLAYYDLAALSEGQHFANDVALDDEGNAYVTDSFAPMIYKVDTTGKTTIFAQNPLFKDADGFNLNGIAYHKGGYLLVGKYNSGELFKISVSDPSKVQKVVLPDLIKGADGFKFFDREHLFVAVNLDADNILELVSTDDWKTAKIAREVKSIDSMPTSVTRVDDDIWVLNSRLNTLFDPKGERVSDYLLQKF